MSKILTRTGLGTLITLAQDDSNKDSFSGINEPVTALTYSVDINDQNRTLEFNNPTGTSVALESISTIFSTLHTSDFKVTLKNIGIGSVTITPTDIFDDGSSSKVLPQYSSITIQTDSTIGKWNIISRDVPSTNSTSGSMSAADKTLLSITAGISEANKALITNSSNEIISGLQKISLGELRVNRSASDSTLIGGLYSSGDNLSLTPAVSGAYDIAKEIYFNASALRWKCETTLDLPFTPFSINGTDVTVTGAELNNADRTAADGTVEASKNLVADSLSSVNFESEKLKSNSQPIYGMVILDTPPLLVGDLSIIASSAWVTVDMSVKYPQAFTDGAKKAILKVEVVGQSTSLIAQFLAEAKVFLAKSGQSGTAFPSSTLRTHEGAYKNTTSVNESVDIYGFSELTLNLDANSNFQVGITRQNLAISEIRIYLTGYYV